ncbi:hypothetical protein CEXT_498421 [Caerostris extrusa]|uniref:Uncharacterized protein n=1 Tax=Caerostris extrusa TaxID=172846 RepID=A0AAV4TMI9_CAEEX|nr:hypothetical protein CEXT_498421 [Caerostris extrusa]
MNQIENQHQRPLWVMMHLVTLNLLHGNVLCVMMNLFHHHAHLVKKNMLHHNDVLHYDEADRNQQKTPPLWVMMPSLTTNLFNRNCDAI